MGSACGLTLVTASRREGLLEPAAGDDAELVENLGEVSLDGAGAEEQLGPISVFGHSVTASRVMCSACGVSSLCVSTSRMRTLSRVGQELLPGPLGERLSAHCGERVNGRPAAGWRASTRLALGRSQSPYDSWVRASSGRSRVAAQPFHRFGVAALGGLAVATEPTPLRSALPA